MRSTRRVRVGWVAFVVGLLCGAIPPVADELGEHRRADHHGRAGPIPGQFEQTVDEHRLAVERDLEVGDLVRGEQVHARGDGGRRQAVGRDPSEITLHDIVTSVECQTSPAMNTQRPTRASQVLMDVWNASRQAQVDVLESATLADLVERIGDRSENMYYI